MINAMNLKQKQLDELVDEQAREIAKNRSENQIFKQDSERVKEDLLKIVEILSKPKTPPPVCKIPKLDRMAQVYGPRPKSVNIAPVGRRRASSVSKRSSVLSECSTILSCPSYAVKPKQLKRSRSLPRPRHDLSPRPNRQEYKPPPPAQKRDKSPSSKPHFRPEILPQLPLRTDIPEKIGGWSIADCCRDKVKTGSFHCRRVFVDIQGDRMQAFECCTKIFCCSA